VAEEVRKRDVEGISPRAVAFSSHTATNLATLRENASKRNEALLKVRASALSHLRTLTTYLQHILQAKSWKQSPSGAGTGSGS